MNPNSTLTGGNLTCNLSTGRVKSFFTKKGLFYLVMTMIITIGMLQSSFAQLTGSKFIPGNYATVAAAVIDLNTQGVGAGGVIFEVAAGHTETLTARIDLTATGTLANPIVFRKDPATSGANPLLTAYTGTALATGATMDGMWALIGSDYVTIDGINLTDPNTASATTMMEYGYGLFKASATDGANNNTIQNCTITLNRNNNTAPTTGPAFQGSNGIALLASTQVAMQTSITVTAASGASSNNRFYSNTIQNVNAGITLSGFAAATPFTLADTNNDIGGASGATGNTIINFGGGTAAPNACAAVFVKDQWSFNVSYNTVNNNNGSGVNHPTTNRGIFANASSIGASATINNNNITITGGTSTSAIDWAIDCEMAQTGSAGNTISISNNTISITKTVVSTVAFTAIWLQSAPTTANMNGNTITSYVYGGTSTSTTDNNVIRSGLAGVGTLNINNNTIGGVSTTAATGAQYLISVTGAPVTALNINGNNINGVTLTGATTKSFRGIYVSTAVATAAHTINNNNFQNISYSGGTPTGEFSLIYGIGTALTYTISGNTLTGGLTIPSTGAMYLIYNSQSTPNITVTNNTLSGTGINRTGTSGIFRAYYNFGSPVSGTGLLSGNTCSNVTLVGASTFNGFEFRTGTGQIININNNTVSNIVTGSGLSYGIYNGYGALGSTVNNNTISNFSGAGTTYAIYTGSTAAIGMECNNNTISNVSVNGASAAAVYGIFQNVGGANVYSKNKIYGLSANGIGTAFATGIHIAGGTTTTLRNNYIGDITTPIANAANALNGINIAGGTTVNCEYNTVYLNGSSSGALFGSSAINASTTPNLTLRNNVFINNSGFTGVGLTVAYRRSSTTLTSYVTASNQNIFYAGTPSANRLIYTDGTNSDQTISAYKLRVTPSDLNTATENITFLSLTGSSSNFLHVDGSVASYTESGASNVTGITDDFDGNIRQGNVGYVGTGTAPDIGADEYAGIAIAPPTAPVNFGSNTYTINSFNVTWDDNSTTEYGFIVYRSLNIGGPYVAVGAVSSTTSAGTGTSYSLAQTGLLGNTTYYYEIVANATSNSPVLAGSASTLACGGGLSGSYLIPTAYPTIAAALTSLKSLGMTGAVTLELESSYTGAGETYPLIVSDTIGCLNAINTLTLRPEATVAAPLTITSANTTATIDINSADYFTIDGRPGGVGSNKFLIVQNTSTTAAAAGNAILIRNEASNNTVTYVDIRSANANPAANTAVTTIGSIPGALAIGNTAGAFGNDNNTVSNCDVHSTGTNLGACIYAGNSTTAGTSANNDNNSILNNNLYDFFNAASASAGLDIASGNNNWTINGNSVYQTATRNYTTGTQTVRGFWITPNTGPLTSASGFTINNNFIGGAAPSCAGLPLTLLGTAAYNLFGMDISVGTGTASNVQNNVMTNWNITGGFSTNNVYGINIANGNVNVGTVTGNVIGSTTANGAITFVSTVTGGSMIALRSGAGGTINFSNNIVSGIDLVGNATTVATGFNGIAGSGGATIIINNNTIGSTTLTNSINLVSASATSTTATAVRGIICNSGAAVVVNTITNNTISNINNAYSATGTQANSLVGIAVTTGASTVTGNIIRNLTSNTQTSGSGANGAMIGINYTSTTAPTLISGNTIHTLKLTNTGATGAVNAAGLNYSGSTVAGTSNIVEKNNIHSISIGNSANTAGFMTGMDIGSGRVTVKNNMIRLGLTETGADVTSACTVRGITKNTAIANILHNSVWIGGANVGVSAVNTFAFARSGIAVTDTILNNIFMNARSNATTGGKHYAISLSGSATMVLNYNDYVASGTGGVFGVNAGTDYPSYSTNWIPGDANSYSNDPLFINAAGTSVTGDLHIDPINPTIIEGVGTSFASVSDDFDGQTRSGLTPVDVGADAGNFVSLLCNGIPTAGTAVAGNSICISGTTTVSLTGFSNIPGITLQWKESAVSGGPYTNVASGTGATTASYTTGTLTANNYYVCEVTCSNGGAFATSTEALVVVNNPTVASTTPGSRCGTGTVLLAATASSGGSINWYAASTGGSPLLSPSVQVPVTGFNNDIVANGVGSNSTLGFTYATIGVDGAGYVFIDSTYKYTAANALPTCYMPSTKLATSAQTSGLVHQFQDYGNAVTLNNNALSIANQSSGYVSPLPSSGTLTLTTPASYANLVVLYESVVNTSPMLVDATVTFTDATTQVFAGNTCVNWFTVSAPAYSGMGRATPAGVIQCGTTPNMFELNLPISVGNQAKQVQSISFNLPAVLTGTFPYNINYFHAMAVGGQLASTPGSFTTPVISTTTTYYAEPSSTGGTQQTSSQGVPTVTTSTQNGGVIFNINVPLTINSIQVYSSAVGTATVTLQNSALTTLFTSAAIPIVNGGLSSPQTLNLGWTIPAGSGYRIQVSNTGNALGYSTGVFPYPMGNGVGSVVNGALTTGTSTLNYFVYNINTTNGCIGARVPVVATITSPPTLTITPSGIVCNGSIQRIVVTSTLSGYDSYIWSPLTNLFEDSLCTIPYSGSNQDTIYLKSAVGGNFVVSCNGTNSLPPNCANVVSSTFTVQPPTTAVVSSVPNPSCAGTNVVLTALVASPASATVGTGTLTSTGAVSPYYRTFEGAHRQYLFTQAELAALGFSGGSFTQMNFPVTISAAPYNMDNFGVRMANTSATALTAFQTPTFTTVYTAGSFTPVSGNNNIVFSTPFNWDGVSNVLIDMYFDNDPNNTCSAGSPVCWGNTSTVQYSTTAFTSVVYNYSDNATGPRVMSSITTVTGSASTRPNIILTGNLAATPNSYSWSDGSSVVGTTNPLTVTPSVSTNYTVTAIINGCPIISAPYAQNVIVLPATPTASAPSTQCGYGAPAASVTSNSGLPTPFFNWYSAASGGTLLQSSTSTTFTGIISASTTFYVCELSGICESPRVAVVANVTSYDPIAISANLVTCVGTPNTFTVTQTGSTNTYVYSWTATPLIGSGVSGTPSGSPQTFTANIPGFYNYIVTGVDASLGCTVYDTVTVNNYGGLAGTVTPTQISGCANPTGLITANVTGAGTVLNETFTSNTLPSNMVSAGNDFAITGGQMRFTSSAVSKNGGVLITNTTGLANDDFQIDFDMITTPGSGSPADGFSYSYGPDVVALPTGLGSTVVGTTVAPNTTNPENGSGTGLKLGFDAYLNGANTPGIYLMYNCPVWNQSPASSGVIAYISNTSWRATTTAGANTHVTIKINALGQVSLWLNGVQVVTDAPLPGSYLASNKATWNHAFCGRTGAEYQGHFIDNLLIQYNNFYEYSINGGGSWSTTNPIVAPGPGTYTVDARYVSVPACMTSLGAVTINAVTHSTVSSLPGVCSYTGAMPLLSITPSFASATYQWESSPAGLNTWNPIGGATSATYTPAPGSITVATDFRCVIRCGGVPIASSPSTPVTVTVDAPVINSTTPATRCGQGTVNLAATGSGSVLQWYASASGGPIIGTGSPFTTPVISATTNYWVSSSTSGGTTQVSNSGLPTVTTSTQNVGVLFDLNQQVVLNSIDVYSTAAGTVTVSLVNSSLVTLLTSAPIPVVASNLSTPQTLYLGWSVLAGTGYRLLVNHTTNALGYHTGTFPIILGNGVGSITNGATSTGTTTLNYYVYNMSTSVGCESPRTQVTATVTAPPAITVSSNVTICDGQSTTLTVTSANDPAYTYVWTPGPFTGASYGVSPTVNTTYTVTATDNTAGPNAGCSTVGSVTVTVNPNPSVPVITQNPLIVCGSSPVTLTASSTQPGVAQVGTGTGTNVAVGQSPYSGNWEGSKIQYLITAAELNALNIYAGQLTSIAFNVTTIGVTFPMTAYTVKIGQTAASALTAYEVGLTQVYSAPGTIIPTLGWNTYNFSSGFNWNGTSNIVIEVCHNNDPVGACASCYGGTATVQSTTTATQTVYGQYADNTAPANPWDLCSQISTGTVSQSTNRPNMQVGYGATTNFLWSTGASTAAITVTPPSGTTNYSVVATNVFGCTSTNNSNVTSAPIAKPVIVENDTTLCNTSQIYIHVQDTGVYAGGYPNGTQFTWSAIGVPIIDLDSISSINGSSYSVIVTLPNGCTSNSDTAIVLTKSVAVVDVITNASCVGGGSVSVTVTSGLADFNYVWSTDLAQTNIVRNVTKTSNKDTLANLAAGTYYLQVYDEAGTPASCNSGVLTYIVGGSSSIVASVTPTDITCNGNANGAADVTWTGGNSPFSITWSDGTFANTTPRTIALGGSYSVIVSDLSGCADTVAFAIVEPSPVTVTFTSTPESFPGALDGTVTASPAGGTGPYTFAWADEFFAPAGSGNPLTGLAGGLYYGLVTDANACDNSATVLDDSIRVDVITSATFNVTALFEGFYDGVSGLVPALLNSGVGLSATECDTIYVELRDQLSPTTVLASGTAVMNTNGQASFTFPGSVIGQNGYIAIFHRNAVQTWSDVVTFSGVTNYNFTTAATQAFGSNQVQVAPGVWAMYSGDLSPQDEFIDILDQGVIDNDIFNFAGGYVVSDLNGDGFVDIVDQSIVDNNIFNFIGSSHP